MSELLNYAQHFIDYYEDRAAETERRELERRDENTRRREAARFQRREDEILRAVSEPGLDRAMDRAAVEMTRLRMKNLEVKIGESLAAQVKDGVREAFNEMSRRGHSAYMMDTPEMFSRGYARAITVELPAVAYRIYQRNDTWEWVG